MVRQGESLEGACMFEEIKALKELLDSGAITQEEYAAKKEELLFLDISQDKNEKLSTSKINGVKKEWSGDSDVAAGGSRESVTIKIPDELNNRKPFFGKKTSIMVAAIASVVVVVLIAFIAFGVISSKPSVTGFWKTELFSSSGVDELVVFLDEVESYINMSDDGTFNFKFGDIDLNGTWKRSEAVSEKADSIGITSCGYKVDSAYFLDGFIRQYAFLVTDESGKTKLIVTTEENPKESVLVYYKADDSAA